MADPTPLAAPDPLSALVTQLIANPPSQAALATEAKSLLQSRTVWSAVIAIAAGFLKDHVHLNITAADQASLVTDLLALLQYGGAVGAIVFRVLATKAVA
jgi:hypothetical protein